MAPVAPLAALLALSAAARLADCDIFGRPFLKKDSGPDGWRRRRGARALVGLSREASEHLCAAAYQRRRRRPPRSARRSANRPAQPAMASTALLRLLLVLALLAAAARATVIEVRDSWTYVSGTDVAIDGPLQPDVWRVRPCECAHTDLTQKFARDRAPVRTRPRARPRWCASTCSARTRARARVHALSCS